MSKEWVPVALARDVPEGGTLQVPCGAELVCLYRLEGKVYATQDVCTHGAASLAEGYVDGDRIECPFHQGLFHIPTGKAVGAPCTVDLRVYEVTEQGDEVLLRP
jgi:naphthalene 1,2-dioxygenase system ferredoxin subunit